jgi:transposase
MRLGWFRPVQLLETESSLRGILRGFGLKVGKTTPVGFEGRIRELVAGHPNLEVITPALLSVRAVLRRQLNDFEKRLRAMARADTRTRLLISKNGDGSVRAVLYEAGHLILTRPLKGCTALKSWAMRIAKRAGMKKAAVALARKLAVIMHRMLVDGHAVHDPASVAPCLAPSRTSRLWGGGLKKAIL